MIMYTEVYFDCRRNTQHINFYPKTHPNTTLYFKFQHFSKSIFFKNRQSNKSEAYAYFYGTTHLFISTILIVWGRSPVSFVLLAFGTDVGSHVGLYCRNQQQTRQQWHQPLTSQIISAISQAPSRNTACHATLTRSRLSQAGSRYTSQATYPKLCFPSAAF